MESDDSGIKAFFEHVLNRTEEILSQSSTASNERHAEVLTHVDLLERTVRLTGQLAGIVTEETDLKLLDDLRLVFSELLEKFSNILESVHQEHLELLLFLVKWWRREVQVDHRFIFRQKYLRS